MAEQEPGTEMSVPENRLIKEELELLIPAPESYQEPFYIEVRDEFIEKAAAKAVKTRPKQPTRKRTQTRRK
jgi:hypothetical protein